MFIPVDTLYAPVSYVLITYASVIQMSEVLFLVPGKILEVLEQECVHRGIDGIFDVFRISNMKFQFHNSYCMSPFRLLSMEKTSVSPLKMLSSF